MNNQPVHGGGGGYDRDREMMERQRASDEIAQRERENERPHREPYHSGAPHHSSAGSLPIHQPVASRISGAIHSPGGLLANHGSSAPSIPLGAPPGPVANFGGPLHEQGSRPSGQHGSQNNNAPSHQLYIPAGHSSAPSTSTASTAGPGSSQPLFGGPLPVQESQATVPQGQPGPQNAPGPQAPAGSAGPAGPAVPGVSQAQQPILTDALSYLDQVKYQFQDQPDVYNRFLDIMKDFKSQTIDTPGVINRVSELFAGHPTLIQGFNTFLPPGYRIECGAGNDPNTIRVTTPMGTTVQSIAGRRPQPGDATLHPQGDAAHPHGAGRGAFFNRPGWQQQPQPQPQPPQPAPQQGAESPEMTFAATAQNGPAPAAFNPPPPAHAAAFDTAAGGQSRAGPQPQGAGLLNSGPGGRNALTPTPAAAQGVVNGSLQAHLANQEKQRGPVEFNHAISYVNKIKNRFQDKPEIYKQFLDILQTYQRESKAITEVYAQVTALFHTAPDLLEDFKQFLPEGPSKATLGRPEDGPVTSGTTPQPMAGGAPKMPPLGSFAPPPSSASKDSKKRPRIDKQTPAPMQSPAEASASGARGLPGVPPNKKAKLAHKAFAVDATVEPSLTPVMPEPIPPPSLAVANQEDLGFFDKVKKYLGNKSSMSEFLKLCNLFTQQIIDVDALYHRGCQFFLGNPDLMNTWKSILNYEPQDVLMENRPTPPTGKVSLSNCRACGPSYRLLPRRERLKPCSGRDELCNSVLNDNWASHPTWASEDSGFVAHRKNAYEEGLHRIEEERHDYDFNVEANIKCIQLLEPIAQQMLVMSDAEKELFRMPAALAGQTTSIFKRVCKKLYGETGIQVVNDLFSTPFSTVPVVLMRMKQKDEEWRFAQREWEKVWHQQTEHMHLRSLDHMGILVKQTDKRNFSAKHLVDVIKTKYEEQRRQRSLNGKAPRHQFTWSLTDKDVILDLLRLMGLYAIHNSQHSNTEKERVWDFFVEFIPAFFELDETRVLDRVPKLQLDSGEEDGEDGIPAELTNGRSRRNGKKGDLLRGVLDPGRNGSKSRATKEDSASGSKETTPDVQSGNEDDVADAAEDEPAVPDMSNERWMPTIPKPTIVKAANDNDLLTADNELKADGFFTRPWYNFFCNQTIFVFFSVLETLYKRLKEVKEAEQSVVNSILRIQRSRPSKEVGLSTELQNFFTENDSADLYWPKTMELIEDYITGEIDENRYQDILRHYYLATGWKLYTIQDLIRTLCRLALTCSSSDGKEKTNDLIKQFLQSREREETSYQTEISARKFAEKCIKDGEMFVICWVPQKSEASVRWLQREETTFYMDEMKLQQRWQYYISSYIRVEPTEGVPRSKLSRTVMARNLPSLDDDETAIPKPASYDENLVVSICLKSTQMVWGADSSEGFRYEKTPESKEDAKSGQERSRGTAESRKSKMAGKFVMNNAWMKDLSQEEVDKLKAEYKKRGEGEVGEGEGKGEGEKTEAAPPTPPPGDVEMTGA